MKVALVYDRVAASGGAEQVLKELHTIWPEAPLFTSVYASQKAPWASDFDVKTSFVQRIPGARKHHEWLAPLMPYAFESLNLSEYDVIISVTSAEAKGVITQPNQLHVSYLLTPTRYLWSMSQSYTGRGIKKIIRLPFLSSLRRWDQLASKRPDHIIAISHEVEKRVEKYYQRSVSAVIYPGIDWNFFSTPIKSNNQKHNYWLMVGRLVSYKKFSWVIDVFRDHLPDEKLIIVGTGKKEAHLRNKVTANIRMVGQVDRQLLREYYQCAKGLIFPQEEDFGLIPLEAQASGTPVLAYGRGGALETVISEKTGLFFRTYDATLFIDMLKKMENKAWDSTMLIKHAKQFDNSMFRHSFTNQIKELWQKKLKQ
jgi:glycosyltransferase involved in cell wall biosynthesis